MLRSVTRTLSPTLSFTVNDPGRSRFSWTSGQFREENYGEACVLKFGETGTPGSATFGTMFCSVPGDKSSIKRDADAAPTTRRQPVSSGASSGGIFFFLPAFPHSRFPVSHRVPVRARTLHDRPSRCLSRLSKPRKRCSLKTLWMLFFSEGGKNLDMRISHQLTSQLQRSVQVFHEIRRSTNKATHYRLGMKLYQRFNCLLKTDLPLLLLNHVVNGDVAPIAYFCLIS